MKEVGREGEREGGGGALVRQAFVDEDFHEVKGLDRLAAHLKYLPRIHRKRISI